MDEGDLSRDDAVHQRVSQSVQCSWWQFRPFDSAQQILIGERVKTGECLNVPFIDFARQHKRVVFDSVKHRRSDSSADIASSTNQIFQKDTGRRTITRTYIFDI